MTLQRVKHFPLSSALFKDKMSWRWVIPTAQRGCFSFCPFVVLAVRTQQNTHLYNLTIKSATNSTFGKIGKITPPQRCWFDYIFINGVVVSGGLWWNVFLMFSSFKQMLNLIQINRFMICCVDICNAVSQISVHNAPCECVDWPDKWNYTNTK